MGEGGIGESSEAVSQPPGPSAGAGSRTVFLSYASSDAEIANSVCQFLESHGVSCWMAPRDVKAGSVYADAIVRAINEANALVLVLSGAAMASEHVGREVERAASKRKQIVAFRVDAARLSAELEYFLSRSQWIDAPALGMPGALVKLGEAVAQGSATSSQANPGLGSDDASGRSTINRAVGTSTFAKRVVVAAAIVIVVAIALTLAIHFWPLNDGDVQAPAVAAISDKSIAVLPFADMSQKKDQEYFGDGMAEEILDLLAKIPGLSVIGRTSSFQFKGKNEDLRTIGTKLSAAYVLEGSVRNSGDQVRITAQLINTRTGAHEWSETYDRPIGDVLKLQDAIAAAVARELELTVAPGHLNQRATAKNAEAYDLYLRGRHAADRWNPEGFDEAVTLFHQALDRDPTFADAAAELAFSYQWQAGDSLAPAAGYEQARRSATDALKLDPKNLLAHVVMAEIHFIYDWDWGGAERELQQAATLAPANVDVLRGEAHLSVILRRSDDAFKYVKAALAQDPLNPLVLVGLSWIQESRGHLSEADAAIRRALDIRPTFGSAHQQLGVLLLERGDRDGALREMQQETLDYTKQEGLALAYYALGKKTEADAALAGMLKDQADGNALGIAEVYAFRNHPDEAMHWLERAYAQKDGGLYAIKRDWLLRGLESDPRFKAFLHKMNLPE
jgi:TolB-like protein